jgi:hypothetical protein
VKFLTLLLFSATAFAGEKTVVTPEPPVVVLPWSLKLDTAWVGQGDYDRGGHGSVFEGRVQLALQQPLALPALGSHAGQWVLRLGGEWERFGFDHSDGAPQFLPGTLQSVAALIALEYRTPGGLGVLVEARPGVFFEHHVTADSFDVPVKAAAAIPFGDRFAMVLGATYHGFRKNPVIPIGGIFWRITDTLTLNAIPPDPRLEWQVNETTRLWLGGELAGGSFRTDAGRDDKLNEAVVTYTDYRAAAGVAWTFANHWSLDVGAGASFYRKWDFHRAEVGVKTDDTAPFVKLSLRGEW